MHVHIHTQINPTTLRSPLSSTFACSSVSVFVAPFTARSGQAWHIQDDALMSCCCGRYVDSRMCVCGSSVLDTLKRLGKELALVSIRQDRVVVRHARVASAKAALDVHEGAVHAIGAPPFHADLDVGRV